MKLYSHKEPDMSTEKISSDIRKEQIIEAALDILSNKDVQKLKIAEIARYLGLAPSALYRHFRNRDAILSAILEHIRERLYKNLENVRQTKTNAVDRLQALLFRHAKLIEQNQGIPRIVFSDEIWGQEKTKRQRMYRIVTGYLAELEDIVLEGQGKGEICRDVDAAVVARMFLGIVQPAALLWHMSDGDFDIEGHIEGAWPVFKKLFIK